MSLAAQIVSFFPVFGLSFQAGSGRDGAFAQIRHGKIIKYCQYFSDSFPLLNSTITVGNASNSMRCLSKGRGNGLQSRAIGDRAFLKYICVNRLITVAS